MYLEIGRVHKFKIMARERKSCRRRGRRRKTSRDVTNDIIVTPFLRH